METKDRKEGFVHPVAHPCYSNWKPITFSSSSFSWLDSFDEINHLISEVLTLGRCAYCIKPFEEAKLFTVKFDNHNINRFCKKCIRTVLEASRKCHGTRTIISIKLVKGILNLGRNRTLFVELFFEESGKNGDNGHYQGCGRINSRN